MESLSRPRRRSETSSVALSRKLSGAHSFSAKHAYDDVFLGAKRGTAAWSSRIDDYAEIFGGSRGSSIPVLDLSALDESEVLAGARSSKLDYSRIFGGFRDDDVAVSYEELFGRPAPAKNLSAAARTPAKRASSLEGLDDLKCPKENQKFSYEAAPNSSDDTKQFSMSYHKTSQRSSEGKNGTTRIAQIRSTPGYTCFIDESAPPQKTECDKPLASSKVNGNISKQQTFDGPNNCKSQPVQDNLYSADKLFDGPYQNSAQTHPTKTSPPSSLPANLLGSRREPKRSMTSNFKIPTSDSSKDGCPDFSPSFSDEEADINSTAAASVAALRKALEKAQTSIRIAKEIMERKKDGSHRFPKQSSKDAFDVRKRREDKIPAGANRAPGKSPKEIFNNGDISEVSTWKEKEKAKKSGKVAPDFKEIEELLIHGGTTDETNGDKLESAGEYEGHKEVCESVNTGNYAATSLAHQHSGSRITMQSMDVHESGEEMKTTEEILGWPNGNNENSLEEVCELEDAKRIQDAVNMSQEVEKCVDSRLVTTEKVHELEEIDKAGVSQKDDESDAKQKASLVQEKCESESKACLQTEENDKTRITQGVEDWGDNKKASFGREECEKEFQEPLQSKEFDKIIVAQEDEKSEENKKVFPGLEKNEEECKEPLENFEGGKHINIVEQTDEYQTCKEKMRQEYLEKEKNLMVCEDGVDEDGQGNGLKRTCELKEVWESHYIASAACKEACNKETDEERLCGEHYQEDNLTEESEKGTQKSCDREEIERRQQETLGSEDYEEALGEKSNVKRQNELHKEEDYMKKLEVDEVHDVDVYEKKLKDSCDREESETSVGDDSDWEGNETFLVKTYEYKGTGSRQNDGENPEKTVSCHSFVMETTSLDTAPDAYTNYSCDSQSEEAHEHGENDNCLKVSQDEPAFDENKRISNVTNISHESIEQEDLEATKTKNQTGEGMSETDGHDKGAGQQVEIKNEMKDGLQGCVFDENPADHDLTDSIPGQNQTIESEEDSEISSRPGEDKSFEKNHEEKQSVEMGVKMEESLLPNVVKEKEKTIGIDNETNTSEIARKDEEDLSRAFAVAWKEPKEHAHKEANEGKEHLRRTDEANKRVRELENDRMIVERAIREARERAFAEARERAERAAVERATAEVRQRAMAEAREKIEKASAASKPSAEKASKYARLRAERAAVERATAEARERALEKALSQKITSGDREPAERFVGDRFSAVSRDNGVMQNFSSSDQQGSDGTNGESAQRCKARLERQQRTMERAAKALAEKNMRDLMSQKEQAERNRLAETLDADVKRWSSGKEGNLRALLSTLQYILGPDSGWQPVSLTDILTTAAVKKAYRKATLHVHPDKLQQRGASIQQKYICEKVFDLLKAAWNKFNSEER